MEDAIILTIATLLVIGYVVLYINGRKYLETFQGDRFNADGSPKTNATAFQSWRSAVCFVFRAASITQGLAVCHAHEKREINVSPSRSPMFLSEVARPTAVFVFASNSYRVVCVLIETESHESLMIQTSLLARNHRLNAPPTHEQPSASHARCSLDRSLRMRQIASGLPI